MKKQQIKQQIRQELEDGIQLQLNFIKDAIAQIKLISSSADALDRLDELEKISKALSHSAVRIDETIWGAQDEIDYLNK